MARKTETKIYDDETGELFYEGTSSGSPNGKGYVLMYTEKVQELILEFPTAATMKVFMYLSLGQQFNDRGMITTKKAVQDKLHITKPTCLEAFKWLKEHFIINEFRVDGHTEFMVNPDYVTVGRDRASRKKEWVRRWNGALLRSLPDPKKSSAKKKSTRSISIS